MSTFHSIDDADDPRLEPYRDVRERDLAGRFGLFIAEGELVVRTLARSPRHRIRSLLCLHSRAERLTDIAAHLPPDVPAFAVERSVFDRIAGFPIHRGVLAIGERGTDPGADSLLVALPPRSLALALIGMSNHDNVGALFRNAAAFGVGAVLLDDTCCDPLYRKAIRVSVGHALMVPFSHGGSGNDVLNTLARHDFDAVALTPAGGVPLASHAWRPRTALLLGSEGPGLPQWLLARSRTVTIPMAIGVDSLNVATAAGIALCAAVGALATQA